ncbi:NAD(P)-binding protein [Gymnopus androsaceus JB14]|uniref:D-xylose 1-dehydrogenase (NADP(+), D-xylono-1,5-lactone-forming) n=1 Tax=Gymnopus androsaceus JB14 TaxID=1447944 RepID=A0A6A4H9H0_9AGAR|nr:NAD(P)-binding protein [Gymnopus androsaceus JB14]
MASIHPMVLRWGIISTGSIAAQFSTDLLIDPKTRNVHDITHKITAVGSRTLPKAQEFIDTVLGGDKSIKAYGDYEEIWKDDEVDVIYIGTPHTHHYSPSYSALNFGKKHVLCEKPVTSNLAELQYLIKPAKLNGLFFMEAMWTRFLPLSLEVKKISDGLDGDWDLGLPLSVHADLSGDFNIHNIPKTHRILDPVLGGGALLDLGPYPLVWTIMALYEHPAFVNTNNDGISVKGSMLKTLPSLGGVDCNTSFVLNFQSKPSSSTPSRFAAQATLSCSINTESLDPGVTIRYERGMIKVAAPIYVPKSFSVVQYDGEKKIVKEEKREFEYVGRGMHYQADEVARCIRDGKTESSLWGHEKSLFEMWVFDEVCREYEFPPGVEKVT